MTPECTYRWAKNSGSYPHPESEQTSSVAHHRWLIIGSSSSVAHHQLVALQSILTLETGHTYSIFSTASTVMAQWTTCPRPNHRRTNKSLSNSFTKCSQSNHIGWYLVTFLLLRGLLRQRRFGDEFQCLPKSDRNAVDSRLTCLCLWDTVERDSSASSCWLSNKASFSSSSVSCELVGKLFELEWTSSGWSVFVSESRHTTINNTMKTSWRSSQVLKVWNALSKLEADRECQRTKMNGSGS